MPVDVVRSEERQVDPVGARMERSETHRARPVLVMAERDQRSVMHQQPWTQVQVDVGPVRDVESQPFGEEHDRRLDPEEVAGAPPRDVGSVERHDTRTGAERAAGAVVEAVSAPVVVCLPRGDRVLDHQRGVARVVAERQRHVALRAVAADELQHVDALRPVPRRCGSVSRATTALRSCWSRMCGRAGLDVSAE